MTLLRPLSPERQRFRCLRWARVDGRPVEVALGSEALVGVVEAITDTHVQVAGRVIAIDQIERWTAPHYRGRFTMEAVDEQATRDDTDPEWDLGDPPESVEDKVEEGEQGSLTDEPERLEGTRRQQLSLLAGGEEPDSSSFKMQGGKVPVEGQFDKGDTIDLLVKVRVAEVDFVDKHDKDGYVVGTDRRHIAKPLSIRRYVSEG